MSEPEKSSGPHAEVRSRLAAGTPQVATAIDHQLAGMMRGENTSEGEDAQALQRIGFEVVQGEARNSHYLGKYDDAERLFLEVRPLAAELGISARIDFHLAVIAVGRSDTATAQRLLASIAPAFESGMFRPRRGALRQVQADIHLQLDELAWKLQWRRARALVALGRREEAIEAFREGISNADHLRMAPLGYRLDYRRARVCPVRGSTDQAVFEERRKLIAQRDALLEQIRLYDPRWRALTPPARVELDAI